MKKGLGLLSKVVMLVLSVIIDIVQIILDVVLVGAIANRIIDIVMVVIICLWMLFSKNFDKRSWLSVIATVVAELVPFVDVAPFWTLDVIYIIRRRRKVLKRKRQEEEQKAMEEQDEDHRRIQRALHMRAARGLASGPEVQARANRQLRLPRPGQIGTQRPSPTGGFAKNAAVKAISVIQPEIGAAIAVANRVKQVENIVGRKIAPRPGYNRRA